MVADRRFVGGSFYRRDDRSGFKMRSFDSEKEWNGLWIRKDMWEARNSQDYVRGVADEQAVPEPRPTATPIYLGPLTTTLSANAAAGATALTLASSVGMLAGDTVGVLVGGTTAPDAEFQFRTTLLAVPTSTTVTLGGRLPAAASSGSLVTDFSRGAEISAANFPASNGGGPF